MESLSVRDPKEFNQLVAILSLSRKVRFHTELVLLPEARARRVKERTGRLGKASRHGASKAH